MEKSGRACAEGEQQMNRFAPFALIVWLTCVSSAAAQEILEGTWKLISSQRTNQATGVTTDTLGPNPQGFIIYGRDGHMIVIIAQSGRPRAESIVKMTDQQRAKLYSSMIAYAGTTNSTEQRSSITSTFPGTNYGPEPCRSGTSRKTATG